MVKLKLLIIGGTSFNGGTLATTLLAGGHIICVMCRSQALARFYRKIISISLFNLLELSPWQDEISEYEVVLNLYGASIFWRRTGWGRREIGIFPNFSSSEPAG